MADLLLQPRAIREKALRTLQTKQQLIIDGNKLPPTETELFRAYLDELVPTGYQMNQPDTPTSFTEFLKDPSLDNLKKIEHKENKQINIYTANEAP